MNVIITYPWNPRRWTNHPFPHTIGQEWAYVQAVRKALVHA